MTDNNIAYITIFGMGVVTYITRVLGFFVSNRISSMPKPIERFLHFIPGTIIVSIIAPQIVSGGLHTIIAGLICIGAAKLFNNLVAVMLTGVLVVSFLRQFMVFT
jgi:uncharacterized membrane protein